MKKIHLAIFLVLVVLSLYGCARTTSVPQQPTVGVRDTGIKVEPPQPSAQEKPILEVCNKILEGQKARDKNKIMTSVAIDSPDYQAMLKATEALIKSKIEIKSYDCTVIYLKGDTARTNVTISYTKDDKESKNQVSWTYKNLKGTWYFWHGGR